MPGKLPANHGSVVIVDDSKTFSIEEKIKALDFDRAVKFLDGFPQLPEKWADSLIAKFNGEYYDARGGLAMSKDNGYIMVWPFEKINMGKGRRIAYQKLLPVINEDIDLGISS